MMELMRKTFGEDRIVGSKFPQEARTVTKREGDSDEIFSFRKYTEKLVNPDAEIKLEKSKDMNPNGFWECPFTVGGAYYRPGVSDLLRKIEAEDVPSICKIVSQGLRSTDPRYVTKVIYMLREPTAVAKSQERLRRELMYKTDDGETRNLWDSIDKISPRMFIEVSLMAAAWIKNHPDVPIHFVEYSKLMSDPKDTLLDVQNFLGAGDFTEAISAISPNLNRSSKVTVVHPLLPEAESVYESFAAKDWDSLVEFSADRKKLVHRQTWQWACVRSGSVAQEGICKVCTADANFRASLKKIAIKNAIDWKTMPCAYECAFDVDRDKYLSVEDSIKNNHWLDQ